METRPINGTQKGDVYSFAIVLQELMFRAEPYFIDFDSPKGVYRMGYFGKFITPEYDDTKGTSLSMFSIRGKNTVLNFTAFKYFWRLRRRGHDYDLPTVKYDYNK